VLRDFASHLLPKLLLGFALSASACAGVGYDLNAAAAQYRDARYEAAEAWFSALSVEYASMTPAQRAIFHYLSGMTAYRLSQPNEAQHELALAASAIRKQAAALSADQQTVLKRTLAELNPNQFNPEGTSSMPAD
jgi:hypothetical protein